MLGSSSSSLADGGTDGLDEGALGFKFDNGLVEGDDEEAGGCCCCCCC